MEAKQLHTLARAVYTPTYKAIKVEIVAGELTATIDEVTIANTSSDPVPVAVVSGGVGGGDVVIVGQEYSLNVDILTMPNVTIGSERGTRESSMSLSLARTTNFRWMC
jgi:hypothetical protein